MKKMIDIEKLLQWALQDELPKGRPVSAEIGRAVSQAHARRPFSTAMKAGALPDVDTLGFVPGAPHEDALVIAAAIDALPTDTRLATEDDARKLFGEFTAIAGDAIKSMMFARFNSKALIISRAVAGERPQWEFDQARAYQVRATFHGRDGKLRSRILVEGFDADGALIVLHPRRGKAAMKHGAYDLTRSPRSPLSWDNPSPLAVGEARAEYFAWHAALISLVSALRDKLVEFEPTLPAARPFPWITGQAPTSRVLSDGLPAGVLTVALPLRPKRHAGGRPIESKIVTESRPRPQIIRLARRIKAQKAALT